MRREGDRVITTNAVEGFFSILKRGIYGVYQHVSEAHLHRYLTEFDFRYSNREKLGVNDVARASRRARRRKGPSADLRNNSVRTGAKAERYERLPQAPLALARSPTTKLPFLGEE